MAVGCTAAINPHVSKAEGFTGADFAGWEVASQDSYIQTSVTMAGVVLTQVKPERSSCIDDWYFGDAQKDARNAHIRKAIAQYGDYHPSGTILAILLEACGAIN